MSAAPSVPLPDGFTDLFTVSTCQNEDSLFNVMGVMLDFQSPKKCRGTDFMCSWRLVDSTTTLPPIDSYIQPGGRSGIGQFVRFFKAEHDFPPFEGEGDIVLLRKIKFKTVQKQPTLLASRDTTAVIIPALSIPDRPGLDGSQPRFNIYHKSPPPTAGEILYAIRLRQLRDIYARIILPVSIPDRATNPLYNAHPRREKFSLIKDIHPGKYYDLVGQVVKIYPKPSGDGVELHLTDYTSHKDLFHHEPSRDARNRKSREFKNEWPGPYGRLTLTIFLFRPHDAYVQAKVKPENYIFLRNVHIKESDAKTIEGVLHTDKLHPEQVDAKLTDKSDQRVVEVMERKRAYKQKLKEREKESFNEFHGQKRKLLSDRDILTDDEPKLTKKQRQERERTKRLQEDLETSVPPVHSTVTSTEPVRASKASNIKINQNVQCTNASKTVRPLSAVLGRDETHQYTGPDGKTIMLPFLNVCMRATVRVVDFFPSKLEDFCQARKNQDLDDLSDYSGSDCSDASGSENDFDKSEDDGRSQSSTKVWEWRFALLVEDASLSSRSKEKMEVLVFGKDAEFLLRLTAVNLRKDRKTLAQLREKLFILWGDLEERKTAKAVLQEMSTNGRVARSPTETKSKAAQTQKPVLPPAFNCCIKEYGVRASTLTSSSRKANGSSEDKSYGWERKFQLFQTTIV